MCKFCNNEVSDKKARLHNDGGWIGECCETGKVKQDGNKSSFRG